MKKQRLDLLLVELGMVESRNKAQGLIMSGSVLVEDCVVDKPGSLIARGAALRLRPKKTNFVGRGGEKLLGALQHFSIDVNRLTAVDVGSSTGGFTDCLLRSGAQKVFAVDVGTNQLHYSLRSDDRVEVYEKTHVKDISKIAFRPRPDLAVIDLSFISLSKVLDSVVEVMAEDFQILALVKPQFELEKEKIAKGGVVKDPELEKEAVEKVKDTGLALKLDFRGSVASSLKGSKKGNQEYFVLFSNQNL